ncbi:MAG TPA: LytTR family DNA-binding domain-containing protein [Bacteroidales bacterium]|nr:LytTR family DNA-binding domain-containing protein [Bacteroidales bacterium]
MNCIIIDDDPVIQMQLSAFINKSDLLNLKGTFKNPLEANQIIKTNEIDIIFLDIEMPEMSGLEFLDEADTDIRIIVISGDRKYALNTFEYDVTDYLLKPIEYTRFLKSVYKSIEKTLKIYGRDNSDRIFVRFNNQYIRLKINDIVSIKKEDNKDLIITRNKSFSISDSDINFNNVCSNSKFCRINNSCIVNLNEIREVCDNFLIFKDSAKMDNILVEENIANEISDKLGKLYDTF